MRKKIITIAIEIIYNYDILTLQLKFIKLCSKSQKLLNNTDYC